MKQIEFDEKANAWKYVEMINEPPEPQKKSIDPLIKMIKGTNKVNAEFFFDTLTQKREAKLSTIERIRKGLK